MPNFNSESLLPSRAKSAALVAQPRDYDNNLMCKSMSNSFYKNPYKNPYNNDDEYYSPRRQAATFDSDSFRQAKSDYDMGYNSVRDIVRDKNSSERITDLERTNLKLRRMIQYASIDKLNVPDSARLIETDRSIRENISGPPVLRQGRIGSSWRHIKQTNNYSNSNLLFVDGTVRIDDSSRYPPRMYGYPPKVNLATHRQTTSYQPTDRNEHMLGLGNRSLSQLDLPVNNLIRNRPVNLNPYENKYQQRAKEGFEYWSKDKRYPENNKPKAKLYTTGAYKTFHGLSDSLLKT